MIPRQLELTNQPARTWLLPLLVMFTCDSQHQSKSYNINLSSSLKINKLGLGAQLYNFRELEMSSVEMN